MKSSYPARRGRGLRHRQSGFSLHDLLVTSAITGTLSVGAIGMMGMVQDSHLTGIVNQLMGDLNLARSEAIKRHATVTLCKSATGNSCASSDAWNKGWIVFVDENDNKDVDATETVIRVQQSLGSGLHLRYGETGTYYYVRYNPSGEAWPGATFTLCDSRGADQARAVIVYWAGRPRISAKTSDGKKLNCG